MRNIYLIRHGEPFFPTQEHYCLGITDLPLTIVGKFQACLLACLLQKEQITSIYSSPLQRCIETAHFLTQKPDININLREQNMGIWDGLPFSVIKNDFSDLYEKRGSDQDIRIPDAETLSEAGKRFSLAMHDLLANSKGNVAVFAHSSVNRSFLSQYDLYSFSEPWFHQPYGSYFQFSEDQGLFSRASLCTPHPEFTAQLCDLLLKTAGLPDHIIAHCHAVSKLSLKIAEHLSSDNYLYKRLDLTLLQQGALLHDIARLHPKHSQTGALWLNKLGYPKIAELIRQHSEPDDPEMINEASILFLADKYTLEDKYVTIEERFQKNAEKCKTPEGKKAFQRRYQTAKLLEKKIFPKI